MPERPDLDYVIPVLHRELAGAEIAGVRVKKPVVLRVAVPGDPAGILAGRAIDSVGRRAHAVWFRLLGDRPAEVDLVVLPMLAGRFAIAPRREARSPGALAVAFSLADGRELRYVDDVQMGKVWIIPKGRIEMVPDLASVGVDVMNERSFTRAKFRELARERRDQAKVFLLDKTALDALGNAYADEVLFEARIHPKTFVAKLSDADLDRLHDAIVRVLSDASAEIRSRKPSIDEKVRDFLKVRNRHGTPCPRCRTKIRKAGVHGHDAFFCPRCQPETRRSGIVDWRELS